MKILLINSNRYRDIPAIPFGLCCVAAALERDGYFVKILDLFTSLDCLKSIESTIATYQPDCIGIGIRNIDNGCGYGTEFFLEIIKNDIILPCKENFNGPIVIGGAAVGVSGEEMLVYFDLPYAIRGDGEKSVVEFIQRYENNQPFQGISGLIVQKDGEIVENNPPKHIDTVNYALNSENIFRFVNVKAYNQMFNARIPIQTKRGCPLSCVYCTYNAIEGKRFRLRDPMSIADEIETIVSQTSLREFEFTDSVFNFPIHHCKEVLSAIIGKKLDINLKTMGLNPCSIDEELVDLMKESGFTETDLSAESLCDATLESLGKNYRKEDVLKTAKMLHQRKIHVNWFLLFGAPNETEETIAETIETVKKNAAKWDLITAGAGIRVYKNAPISKVLTTEQPEYMNSDFFFPVGYSPQNISLERIMDIIEAYSSENYNLMVYNQLQETKSDLSKAVSNAVSNEVYRFYKENIFSPDLPSWQLYIIHKRLMKALSHFQ